MKIDNNFTGFFYNKFDFVIRFLYCRMPFINKLFFWKLYTSDFKKLDFRFEEIKKLINGLHQSFKGKVCLELGPGNSYLNAYNLLMNGAKKVILVDKFSRYIKTKRQKEFFNKELNYIRQKYAKKDLFFIKDGEIDEKYIEFIEGDFTKINFKKKVDFVLTISVFEHIKDVEEVIAKLSKVMKKGGLMYHSIDLRDHYNFNNPFLFYKYSKKTWENYLTKEGVSYTNRVRYDNFKRLFKRYEFKIIKEEVKIFPMKFKEIKINKEFKNQENLDVGILKILVKKYGEALG